MREISAMKLSQSLDAQSFNLMIRGVGNEGGDLDELCAKAHLYDAVDAMRSIEIN